MLLLVLFALASATDPSCAPAVFQDPQTGRSYTYDLSQLKAPDFKAAEFLRGAEHGQIWVAHFNICGDASVVGCSEATPCCQEDGAGKYVSMGTPQSWTVEPYYDPASGPSGPKIYDGGVVVTIGGGAVCSGNSVSRNMHIFLKCDATVTNPLAGSTFLIDEVDPSSSVQTPCTYWTTIKHASFCPQPQGGGGTTGPMPLHSTTLNFMSPIAELTIIGSSASSLLDLGLSCKPTCTEGVVECTGSLSQPTKLIANVSFVKGADPEISFTLASSSGSQTITCPNEQNWYLVANGRGLWAENSKGLTAYVQGNAFFSASNPISTHCVTCTPVH